MFARSTEMGITRASGRGTGDCTGPRFFIIKFQFIQVGLADIFPRDGQ